MSLTTAAHAHAAGLTSDDWIAIGTLALAAITVLGLAVTIWLTVGDRRRADRRLEAEIQRERNRVEAERLREQEAEAYLVEVAVAFADTGHPDDYRDDLDKHMAAAVINHGHYTITQVEAQYCVTAGGNPSIQPFGGPKECQVSS